MGDIESLLPSQVRKHVQSHVSTKDTKPNLNFFMNQVKLLYEKHLAVPKFVMVGCDFERESARKYLASGHICVIMLHKFMLKDPPSWGPTPWQ